MPHNAHKNDGRADQQARGSGRPDVRAEQEDQNRNDQLAAGDAEQAADGSDKQPGRKRSRRAEAVITKQHEFAHPGKETFEHEQASDRNE
jgi:hypothetical protein